MQQLTAIIKSVSKIKGTRKSCVKTVSVTGWPAYNKYQAGP